MNISRRGEFYGETNTTLHLQGITITDTVYTQPFVDWHYHEHAYFTFIIKGNVLEGNKKETHQCSAGSLLFHNWEEPHYNTKPEGYTRGFHIEIDHEWMSSLDINDARLQGSRSITSPAVKLLMYRMFRETRMADGLANLSIESMLIETLSQLHSEQQAIGRGRPRWVDQVDQLMHDRFAENVTLRTIANTVGIHPVHLSRDFRRYFLSNPGDYLRKIRIAKALSLIPNQDSSLTEIALECGFFDQSHFTRSFQHVYGFTPKSFRKLMK